MIAVAVIARAFIGVFTAIKGGGFFSNLTSNLWGMYVCYAMVAIWVDLLWGYTGLLSLGQARFFAVQQQQPHAHP